MAKLKEKKKKKNYYNDFLYLDKLSAVEESLLQHEILDDEVNNPTYGNDLKKHIVQNSSLLAQLRNAGMINENTCFIEFGAGRGK